MRYAFKTSCAIFVLISVFDGSAWAADETLNMSFNDAWKKTMQAFALENIELTTSDQSVGIIQGAGSFQNDLSMFKCDKPLGNVDSREFTVAAAIFENDDGSIRVSINAKGAMKSYRYKKVIFFNAGREFYDIPCESTGKLEQALLGRIAEN